KQHENHTADEVPFDRVCGDFDEVAAVVIRTNFDVGRKNAPIELFRSLLDALEHVLRLLAAAHEDNALDGVVVVLLRGLEAEDAEARCIADFDAANIFHANRRAVVAADNNFADVVGRFYQAKSAYVIKLAALGVETAAGIGIVSL